MTDYAIDIERLQALLDCTDTPWQVDALTAAIDLMRAAAPEDAEAEREHCVAIARTIDGHSDTVRVIARERASARAGHARGKQHRYEVLAAIEASR